MNDSKFLGDLPDLQLTVPYTYLCYDTCYDCNGTGRLSKTEYEGHCDHCEHKHMVYRKGSACHYCDGTGHDLRHWAWYQPDCIERMLKASSIYRLNRLIEEGIDSELARRTTVHE